MTEAPGRRRPSAGGRLAALDGLRLIAALFVALYHYTGYAPGVRDAWGITRETAFPHLHKIGQYGWLGVELFFMISGFVICMSSWGRSPGAFFRSRVTRLFPAYWAAIVITTVVLFLWPVVREHKRWNDVVINFSMMQEAVGAAHVDAVYWTLWNEGLFYLLFAFVVWRGLTLKRAIIFGYGWLIAAMLAQNSGVPLLKTFLQPGYASFFVAGIALYLIHRFGPDLLLWGLLGLSFVLSQYWADRLLRHYNNRYDVDMSPLVGAALVTVFFAVLTLVALGYTSRIRWRWLTTAGVLTYPFYLLHENVGWTVIYGIRGFGPPLVMLGAAIVIMLLAAYLLHRLIEKPLARVMKRKLDEAAASLGRDDRFGRPAGPPAAPAPASPPADTPAGHPAPAQREPSAADTLVIPGVSRSGGN
ncbi:acyltransferase [Actinoplanes sp. DH11]|uniref:acyltransferase family protein n=1 Tax=Actinoplanes sp. DH11 TaxID=2857011 RepID=UPI001E332582|nr:acyltransferase [Actinoplanes sp. DH11]